MPALFSGAQPKKATRWDSASIAKRGASEKLKEHNGPIRITLDEWIHDHDSEWPTNTTGFRTLHGRVVWSGAYYPDGCAGHLVACYRTVHENGEAFTRVAYYDRNTKIEFVKIEEEK